MNSQSILLNEWTFETIKNFQSICINLIKNKEDIKFAVVHNCAQNSSDQSFQRHISVFDQIKIVS